MMRPWLFLLILLAGCIQPVTPPDPVPTPSPGPVFPDNPPTPQPVVTEPLAKLQAALKLYREQRQQLAAFYRSFAKSVETANVNDASHFRNSHQLGLKVLVATVDGFHATPKVGGFIDAALAEAAPLDDGPLGDRRAKLVARLNDIAAVLEK